MEKATFAGGCFWCMESPFEQLEGVQSVNSGYCGGSVKNPSYEQVKKGDTGHVESIQIVYDSAKINYKQLLNVYWRNIDPTQVNGQFGDHGSQYRTVIFYHSGEQKKLAEESKLALQKSGKFHKPIVTEILPFTEFFLAEEYHQDYYKKNPIQYKFFRVASGRDRFLKKHWKNACQKKDQNTKQKGFNFSNKSCSSSALDRKMDLKKQQDSSIIKKDKKPPTNYSLFQKPSERELKQQLNAVQFSVTQKDTTEPAFKNAYWNHYERGIYVDVVSGEPLFSSLDKFDSQTGWPSFTQPIDRQFIYTKEDRKLFQKRIEVRSKNADSHLGHLFNDGPQPTGLRYCINSASLRFIPFNKMEKEGYGNWISLFYKK